MTIIDTPFAAVAATDWQQLRELTPTTSQQVFRAVMNAFARPGTIHSIPTNELPTDVTAAVLPLLALADIMTPVSALRGSQSDSDDATDAVAAIARIVGAQRVPASTARYAFALTESAQLSELSTGTHWSPETAATLVQRVDAIRTSSTSGETITAGWRLTGPGIPKDTPVEIAVEGLSTHFFTARAELVADYPSGIDIILITDDGTLIALSRTTRIEQI